MSTGSAAIPQLKAAPDAEPDRRAPRRRPLARARARAHAGRRGRRRRDRARRRDDARATDGHGLALTAEAPVSWPSGAFVRVDRLTDEARACIERSADFAAAIGSPVLTIHLYAPLSPGRVPRRAAARRGRDPGSFLRFYARRLPDRGRHAADRERAARPADARRRRSSSPQIGGHWRDLRRWHARVPELGFTLRHLARGALPQLRGRVPARSSGSPPTRSSASSATSRSSARRSRSRTSPTPTACSARAFRTAAGELDLDPVVRRLGELCPLRRRGDQRARPGALARHEGRLPAARARVQRADHRRAGPAAAAPAAGEPRLGDRARAPRSGAVPARAAGALRRAAHPPHRRRRLDRARAHHLPRRASARSGSRSSTPTRPRSPPTAAPARRPSSRTCATSSATCATPAASSALVAEERPDVVFHLAAYKHVDWAELYPEEFVDTNLQGSWNVLRAADRGGVDTVIVASTDKAALADELLRADEALHGAADRVLGPRGRRAARIACGS